MIKTYSKIKHQSRSDIVVDRITNAIINGQLSDGELLPAEHQLCEMFGVSRSILREAVRVLASRGLIDVKQGYGTLVCRPKIEVPQEAVSTYLMTNPFTLVQLLEIRKPIEMEVARLAAGRRTEDHIYKLEKTIDKMNSELFMAEEYADLDELFHKVIIDASGNPLFGIMIRSIMANLHISRELAIRHFGIEVVVHEHERIIAGIKKGDPDEASLRMKEHMEGALIRINKVNKLLEVQE